MTERDWSRALATAFQRHLEIGGSGGSSGSGGREAEAGQALTTGAVRNHPAKGSGSGGSARLRAGEGGQDRNHWNHYGQQGGSSLVETESTTVAGGCGRRNHWNHRNHQDRGDPCRGSRALLWACPGRRGLAGRLRRAGGGPRVRRGAAARPGRAASPCRYGRGTPRASARRADDGAVGNRRFHLSHQRGLGARPQNGPPPRALVGRPRLGRAGVQRRHHGRVAAWPAAAVAASRALPGVSVRTVASRLRGCPALPRGAWAGCRRPGVVHARPVRRRSGGRRGPRLVLRSPVGQRRLAGRGRSGCRDPLSKRARVPQGRCAGPVRPRLGLCLARSCAGETGGGQAAFASVSGSAVSIARM